MLPTVSEHRRVTIGAGHADGFDEDRSPSPVLIGEFADDLDHTPTSAVSVRPPGAFLTPGKRHRLYRDILLHYAHARGRSKRWLAAATGLTRTHIRRILSRPPKPPARRATPPLQSPPPRGLPKCGPPGSHGKRDDLIRDGDESGMNRSQLSLATALAPSHVHKILSGRPA